MSIAKITVVGGIVMILLSIVGVTGAIQNNKDPKTALIPFIIGDLLFVCGFFAMRMDHLRKHLMHAAAMLALIAVLLAIVPIAMRGSQMSPLSWITIGGMLVTGLVLEILFVRSFIAARKARVSGSTM